MTRRFRLKNLRDLLILRSMKSRKDKLKKRRLKTILKDRVKSIISKILVINLVMSTMQMKTLETLRQMLVRVIQAMLQSNLGTGIPKNRKQLDLEWQNKLHRDNFNKPKF